MPYGNFLSICGLLTQNIGPGVLSDGPVNREEAMAKTNVKKRTRAICEAAIFIALSLVLGLLRFKIWAQGGSVDFSMIPLIIFALRWGTRWGIGAGVISGLLRFILLDGAAYTWQSLFLDYMLAYGACGLAGFFCGKNWGGEAGTILACIVRFIFHLVSGVVIFGSYMPDVYFGMDMTNTWVYSALYNGSFMLPSMIVAIVVIVILKVPMGKYLKAEDILPDTE